MTDKKTNVITFRTEDWIKEELKEIAELNQWSIAQTVNTICANYLINPYPGEIVIPAKELVKLTKEIEKEGIQKGVVLRIELHNNDDKQTYEKILSTSMLENGGLGQIDGFDEIKGLNDEEIIDIP